MGRGGGAPKPANFGIFRDWFWEVLGGWGVGWGCSGGHLGPSRPFSLLRSKHMARWPWSVVVAGDLRTRDFSDFKELDEDLQDDDWLVEVVRSNRQSITTNLPLHAGSGGRVPPSRSNRRNITTNLHVTNALGQLSSVFGFTSRQKFSSL